MKFKAVIWDLDGTLIDSLADIGDSMNRVLEEEGLPPHEMAAYSVFIGDGIEKLVARSLPKAHLDDPTLTRCIRRMREIYLIHLLDKTKPYDGVPALIHALAERGMTQAVLSNKPDLPTQRLVSACFPEKPFSIVTGALPDVPKKPDPSAALAIARQLGLSPEQFLYFGDTGTDMKTAVAAGMFPVGVLWGFRDAAELLAAGAGILARTPMDLRHWMNRI